VNAHLPAAKGGIKMEEEVDISDESSSRRWAEHVEKAKDDPELSAQLEAAKHVMERYSETLQRLADC
jgi:hypothetical protein